MNEYCIVVAGDIVDGFRSWGPFRDTETAEEWASTLDCDWHIVPLDCPETEKATHDIIP